MDDQLEDEPPTPSFPTDPAGLPLSRRPVQVELAPGEQFELRIGPVAKQLGDTTVRMLAYNGSVPGPTLKVQQGSRVTVRAVNDGDLEQTVHWHGLRLDNRYDGTHETQRPMAVGEAFEYVLDFPDPGLYWYHPHIREDYAQELGLYGNILVVPRDPRYWPPVHRELVITLDDVLLEKGAVAPFSREETNYAAMGRFGNTMLVAGEPELAMTARRGEVVRLYLTNTANTRVFNVRVRSATMKLIGGDSGRVEREELVESVILAPSERVIVDARFDTPGEASLEHVTPERTYQLGVITVLDEPAPSGPGEAFDELREDPELAAERTRLAADLEREPDKSLALIAEMDFEEPEGEVVYVCPMHPAVMSREQGRCPECGMKLMPTTAPPAPTPASEHSEAAGHEHHHGGGDGIEWEDDMVEINRTTTPSNTRWKLRDLASGADNQDIEWQFQVGDRIKLRLINEMDSDHPMHHPFHVHGAGRFLILARDGKPEQNLVWKDTTLITTGETVDLLLDVTNPGRWMAHCHIAEHHESGMMLSFEVRST